MNLYENQIFITLLLLLFVNVIGYLYSLLYVKNLIGTSSRIQEQLRTDLKYLHDHLPLIIFNILSLMLFVFIGLYYFKNFIINNASISYSAILLQLFIILLFDDTFFYFLHRLMHENKFIYRKNIFLILI